MTAFDLAVERLLPWLAQSSVRTIVLIAAVALAMALWRRARPRERLTLWRWVLCATIVLPLSASWLPAIAVPVPASDWQPTSAPAPADVVEATTVSATTSAVPAVADTAQAVSWTRVAGLAYLAGVLMLARRAARRWRAARNLIRGAVTIVDPELRERVRTLAAAAAVRTSPRVAASSTLSVPVTTGVITPAIVLPAAWRTWDKDTLDAVLIHELSHIARRDALWQRVALMYRIAWWPNPAAWWLENRLASLAEDASDDAVLGTHVGPVRYAEILLGFVRMAGRRRPAHDWHLAMARVTGAERRITRVLSWKERSPMSRMFQRLRLVTASAAALVLAGVVAAAQPEVLAAPVPGPIARPDAFAPAIRPLPTRSALDAIPRPVVETIANAAVEAPQQAPSTPRPSAPQTPADDEFLKGAYGMDTQGLTLPTLISDVKPRYTPEAMRAKLQGEYLLEVVVGADGYVARARVAGVSGNLEFFGKASQDQPAGRNQGLDEQALAAVRGWRFSPGTLNGFAVPVVVKVNLSFKLN